MNGDDWKRGMENEAKSVNNALWATETWGALWCIQFKIWAGDLLLGFLGTLLFLPVIWVIR